MGGCEVHTRSELDSSVLFPHNRLSAIDLVGYAAGPELAAAKLTRECSWPRPGLDPRRQNLPKPRSARQEKLLVHLA
eukprot:5183004-Prymnesium_polylepis.1